ncbi:MAG TPA: DUF370 domain-containing protein [Halanaerobiaceae bacterium]|nr:DUF370 domain-containing protein [Bacillota bacterium]HHU91870.1 DUF370 domain-containing protein [Halanaerobiaceae bacterium]HOA40771.1 DUF370 domain-containing protein [Halanaerobiales bacterium]HPZ62977.1 DUF370 domain-containing protein [Halanaerobiales bacterium]HQD04214.1 DUF370 domain-containing protein [Halanaerobiales bacterium]
MFLHLGANYLIPKKEVVLIGDLKSTTYSGISKEFLETAKEEGFIIDCSEGKARTFVLTAETIYLSMISSNTLEKRMKELPGEDGGLEYGE